MEEKQSEVEVFGTWASSFSGRVEIALKLKGIPFEYVEEDLANKSELLLCCNPIYKKAPLLVHKGRPSVESRIILEYIDENWGNSPRLLPQEPLERDKSAFGPTFMARRYCQPYTVGGSKGQEREKAIEEFSELLKVFEEGIQGDFPVRSPFLRRRWQRELSWDSSELVRLQLSSFP